MYALQTFLVCSLCIGFFRPAVAQLSQLGVFDDHFIAKAVDDYTFNAIATHESVVWLGGFSEQTTFTEWGGELPGLESGSDKENMLIAAFSVFDMTTPINAALMGARDNDEVTDMAYDAAEDRLAVVGLCTDYNWCTSPGARANCHNAAAFTQDDCDAIVVSLLHAQSLAPIWHWTAQCKSSMDDCEIPTVAIAGTTIYVAAGVINSFMSTVSGRAATVTRANRDTLCSTIDSDWRLRHCNHPVLDNVMD
jgi:hypothetical protein